MEQTECEQAEVWGLRRREGTGKKCSKFRVKALETGRAHRRLQHEAGELGTDLAEDPRAGHREEWKTLGTLMFERKRNARGSGEQQREKTRRVSSSGCRPWEKLPWAGPVRGAQAICDSSCHVHSVMDTDPK